MSAYTGMPPLVDAGTGAGGGFGGSWNFPSSPPPLAASHSHPSAGATPWAGGSILPGGFGAGAGVPPPQPQANGHRHGRGHRHHSHSRSRSVGPSPSMRHASFQGQGVDPFSLPAAAFDSSEHHPPAGFAYPPPPSAAPPGMTSPPPMGMPSPYVQHWASTTPHYSPGRHLREDPEDDFDPPPLPGEAVGFGGANGAGGQDQFGWPSAFERGQMYASQHLHPHQQPTPQHQRHHLQSPQPIRSYSSMSYSSGSGSGYPSPSGSHSTFYLSPKFAYASNPRSVYKRPSEWREGFSMSKPGPLTRVLSFGKGKAGGFFNKPTLHRVIDAKEHLCSWDVRFPPEHFTVLEPLSSSTSHLHTKAPRALEYLELQEGAMKPEPVRMRLFHYSLPWILHISAPPYPHSRSLSHPNLAAVGTGTHTPYIVTLSHLLLSIYTELHKPIAHADFWNPEVSEEDRKRIYEAWARRVGGNAEEAARGIKRVDFLCGKVIFEGLKKAGSGEDGWEMKMKSLKE